MRPEAVGAGLMLAGVSFLSLNDAVTKALTERYPLGEVVCLRQLASLLVIVPYALATTGLASFRVVDRPGQAWRALAFVGSSALMVASLAALPLAIVTAIAFSSPLWTAALARPFLGELVTRWQWAMIALGFAGVLIIVRPGGATFAWVLLLPAATALVNAARDLLTRHLARTDSAISILIWSNLMVVAVSAVTARLGWLPITHVDALWFLLNGLLNALAHFLMIMAFRHADASRLAPFRYSALVWALAVGWLVWGHVPDAISLLGALVIVVAATLAAETRR